MKYLVIIAILALAGCSSIEPINIEKKAIDMAQINNVMCDGSGFESYFEHEHYISFKCKNGFNSFIKKD
ncbi:membrane lipoprotein [Vibrio phage 1.029.O._10N.261.55.A7]|nr:membrane lipoprotein [Vibrio phage 1.029.O._10N.261.55.A7]